MDEPVDSRHFSVQLFYTLTCLWQMKYDDDDDDDDVVVVVDDDDVNVSEREYSARLSRRTMLYY